MVGVKYKNTESRWAITSFIFKVSNWHLEKLNNKRFTIMRKQISIRKRNLFRKHFSFIIMMIEIRKTGDAIRAVMNSFSKKDIEELKKLCNE